MIKEEKIRMMTQVAMIQKREERRAIEICGYRKKDYVSIQMIKIWICYTMGLFAAYTYRRYLYGQWYTGSFFFKAGAD